MASSSPPTTTQDSLIEYQNHDEEDYHSESDYESYSDDSDIGWECFNNSEPQSLPDMPGHLNDYYPSGEEALQTRRILLGFVPLELVTIILEDAQYMPRLVARNDSINCVDSYIDKYDASWHYLVTRPIPPPPKDEKGEDVRMKLKEVTFWLISCDQGWGGDFGLTGKYDGSWTWFEACIYRRLPGDVPEGICLEAERDGILAPGIKALRAAHIERVVNDTDGKDAWQIQRNVRASSTVRLHEVRWTQKSAGSSDYDNETGAGMGKGFIDALKTGDRIAIISRARFPGWVNNVYKAAVDVQFSL